MQELGVTWDTLTENLPKATVPIAYPEWNENFRGQLDYEVEISKRYIELGYPTVSVSPWLILAIKKYIIDLNDQLTTPIEPDTVEDVNPS
jgi:hypothetical protein